MEKELDSLTPTQKRKYICETISELTYEDIIATYKFLNSHVPSDKFSVHGNGCSINLDNINDKVIDLLYNHVWLKRNG